MKRGLKKAQMKLSFGMIFSIILIVVFLWFSIYAIQKFLGIQRSIQITTFSENLQNDINKMWRGSQGSQEYEYVLPKRIKKVCFVDFNQSSRGRDKDIYSDLKMAYFGSENMIFYPVGSGEGLDSKEIKHINIERITSADNPFCIDNIKGKIKMTIKMMPGENLVTITE